MSLWGAVSVEQGDEEASITCPCFTQHFSVVNTSEVVYVTGFIITHVILNSFLTLEYLGVLFYNMMCCPR
ncbi:hypothetical protein E2C01_032278 [Portunus trituberculatus]|uniref:Uncharacterized protein n=1 Tax=Portunus trituberculatus TaxID=210409 RepID=A0A5B7F2D1_PORTR|nr:hypothetical protein [Portunus trituberculatus]